VSRSWGGRVLIEMLALSMLVFVTTAVPMLAWHRHVMNEAAMARAGALAQWLGSEAGAALQAGARALPDVGARVTREPGVVAYLVLSPTGEVRAPPHRVGETIAHLPGVGVAPGDVLRLRTAWSGDQVEVALPVAAGADPRAAIAALSFRPSAAPGEAGSEIVLAPLLLLSLVLGWFGALRLRRSTLGAMTAFNEDVDLLLAGQLPAVGDPLGTRPSATLAETVNYLVSRLRPGQPGDLRRASAEPAQTGESARTGARAPAVTPRRVVEEESRAAATPQGPGGPTTSPLPREARIVASATFRIEEASPECLPILGVAGSSLTGQHLLDAIADKAILDGVLKCVSKLPPAGEERMTVAPEGKAFRVAITVSRSGRDQPITIGFAPVAGAQA
jgi:hypothetical protein